MSQQNEAELEQFRKQWKAEVSARARSKPTGPAQLDGAGPSSSKQVTLKSGGPPLEHSGRPIHQGHDEVAPLSYHDLEERETGRKIADDSYGQSSRQEPQTALEHYEKAVEKEGQGSLGDSVSLYRKAFRLDASVHEKYKKKHFPPSSFPPKLTNINPSNAAVTVPNTAHHSLDALGGSISDLVAEFSKVSVATEPPPTDLSPSPPCPIASIPEEILINIFLHLAVDNVAPFSRLSQVCKRFAYLVMTEDRIWRRVALGPEFGFAAMHYKFVCTITGEELSEHDLGDGDYILDPSPLLNAPDPQADLTFLPLTPQYPTYRSMLRYRPRLRFSGCYISTVNYTRPGATSSNWTWNAPVLIVTYYRYLRFYRDGSLISLLTTAEPQDVVPYLRKEHLHSNHSGGLPQSVMKDALPGRWRLSGNPYLTRPSVTELGGGQELEPEGDIHIETLGVVPRYHYRMHLSISSAGKSTGTRSNKLGWKGYWSYNKLTDDWAEFGLRNYKPFYWSRVRSYGVLGA